MHAGIAVKQHILQSRNVFSPNTFQPNAIYAHCNCYFFSCCVPAAPTLATSSCPLAPIRAIWGIPVTTKLKYITAISQSLGAACRPYSTLDCFFGGRFLAVLFFLPYIAMSRRSSPLRLASFFSFALALFFMATFQLLFLLANAAAFFSSLCCLCSRLSFRATLRSVSAIASNFACIFRSFAFKATFFRFTFMRNLASFLLGRALINSGPIQCRLLPLLHACSISESMNLNGNCSTLSCRCLPESAADLPTPGTLLD
mmetsp:Transcript_55916/g.92893  ORF Transcript_55916/g.92893 Transcript_55916/m.92893 type:complete len:257 (-) Transcript_55916:803-1573(-)